MSAPILDSRLHQSPSLWKYTVTDVQGSPIFPCSFLTSNVTPSIGNRNEERTYPNALPAGQRVHLVSSLFPSVDWSGVELGKPLPASLRAELEAQGGDVMVSFPPNEAAVLRKYRKW